MDISGNIGDREDGRKLATGIVRLVEAFGAEQRDLVEYEITRAYLIGVHHGVVEATAQCVEQGVAVTLDLDFEVPE